MLRQHVDKWKKQSSNFSQFSRMFQCCGQRLGDSFLRVYPLNCLNVHIADLLGIKAKAL